MNIGKAISDEIEIQGKIKKSIADKVGINPRSFIAKLKNDTFTAEELIKLCILLDLDLNKFREEIQLEMDQNTTVDLDKSYRLE